MKNKLKEKPNETIKSFSYKVKFRGKKINFHHAGLECLKKV